jgi:DNA-binding GntR family transcriptional regulator
VSSEGRASAPIEWRSRVRLVDEISELLRERILGGHYAPGAPLRQEQLAAELNVSRTPLREAFRILESEGLISVTGAGRAQVVAGDLTRLLSAYAVREVLDGLASRLAAERGADAALTRKLDATVAAQRRALKPWRPDRYTAENVAFHRAIWEFADNEFLTAELPIVAMTSQVFMPVELMVFDRAKRAVEEHVAIARAIRSGDALESERVARRHIHDTMDALAATDS